MFCADVTDERAFLPPHPRTFISPAALTDEKDRLFSPRLCHIPSHTCTHYHCLCLFSASLQMLRSDNLCLPPPSPAPTTAVAPELHASGRTPAARTRSETTATAKMSTLQHRSSETQSKTLLQSHFFFFSPPFRYFRQLDFIFKIWVF